MRISNETIIKSISHLRTSVGDKAQYNCLAENKFWGLLCILKNVQTSEIKPGSDYWVDTAKIGDSLNELFYFGLIPKTTSTRNKRWCIRMARNWYDFVGNHFFHGTPNIYAIAAFVYKFDNLASSISPKDLVTKFLSDFHISIDIAHQWFSFKDFPIKFDNLGISRSKLKNQLNQKNDTFSFDNNMGIVAKPSELSRAPFIQTLYAGMEIIKCMLISESDLSKLYPNNITQ